jgi:hypothetical protein
MQRIKWEISNSNILEKNCVCILLKNAFLFKPLCSGCSSVVEDLPRMWDALNSIPVPPKKKKIETVILFVLSYLEWRNARLTFIGLLSLRETTKFAFWTKYLGDFWYSQAKGHILRIIIIHWSLINLPSSHVRLVMAMVQSVIRRLPNSLCPAWKNPWQDTWVQMEFIKS